MSITQAFNEITKAQGGTPSDSGSIASAIDALNDTLAGSDQPGAATIEDAVRLLGQHIGGGSASGTIEITENGEGIDIAQYAYADVNVSGGSSDFSTAEVTVSADDSGVYVYLFGMVTDVSYLYALEPGTLPDVVSSPELELSTSPQTLTACLYQGKALFATTATEENVTVTGNATKHQYGEGDFATTVVTITGNCSIVVTIAADV